jgi:hypothetical protein
VAQHTHSILPLVKCLISCSYYYSHSNLIATIIVLEYSFFSLQKGAQQSARIAELSASEYVASQTPLAIKEAVEDILHQHHDEDGGDEQLCKMIIDKILQMRMCESPLTS